MRMKTPMPCAVRIAYPRSCASARVASQSLDVRENVAILELPAELLRDTPLHRLVVDSHLLGKDGLLLEMEGSAEYLERRKARIDQEVAGKAKGGEIAFD